LENNHMTRLRTFLTVIGCLLLGAPLAFGQTAWDAANDAYHTGKYDEAKVDYLRLVQAGQYSANLFYNLGNAWFKSGDQGRAILNYERALILNPRLEEAEANLRSMLKVVGNDDTPTLRDRAGRYADYFVLTASIAFWIFAFALVPSFGRPSALTHVLRVVCTVAGLVCVAGASAAAWVGEGPKDPNHALVVEAAAELKYGPAVSARSVEGLQIGNQIQILSERGEWTFCRTTNGSLGWILSQKLERIIP
jgi:tetratricopeptide (TPR) repeat protein